MREILVLCVTAAIALGHNHDEYPCEHDKIAKNLEILEEPQPDVTKAGFEVIPMKFFVDFGNTGEYCTKEGAQVMRLEGCQPRPYICKREDLVTSTKLAYIRDILVPNAMRFFESVLSVDSTGPLVVAPGRSCCGIPTIQGTFSETYVLHVTLFPTDGSTLAFAGPCRAHQHTGRPIVGFMNIGPNKIRHDGQAVTPKQRQFDHNIVLHELTHALGFTSNLYPNYFNRDNRQRYQPAVMNVFERGHTVTKVVTPRVLAAARDHFGCPSLNGVELEDQGGDSTQGSHWEKRIFNDEYMTGFASPTQVVSKITLALFQDMGWYVVNDKNAEVGHLDWGYKAGCSFATETCNQWSKEPREYFCDKLECSEGSDRCSHDGLSKSMCNLRQYQTKIPSHYNYFLGQNIGGTVETMDFCPTFIDTTSCVEGSQAVREHGEVMGRDSRCFESTAHMTKPGAPTYRDGCGHPFHLACHHQVCINNNTPRATLRVFFDSTGKNFVDCPQTGGEVDIYQEMKSRRSPCQDNDQWFANYRGGRVSCKSFNRGCNIGQDLGQMENCPVTCGTCSEFNGKLKCPPINKFCSTGSRNANNASTASTSDKTAIGAGIAVLSSVALVGVFATRKRIQKNPKAKINPSLREYLVDESEGTTATSSSPSGVSRWRRLRLAIPLRSFSK